MIPNKSIRFMLTLLVYDISCLLAISYLRYDVVFMDSFLYSYYIIL